MKHIFLISITTLTLVIPCQARPLYDFIIGITMMATGTAFEIQRASAKKDKEEADKNADAHNSLAATAAFNSLYYWGAADWEFTRSGNTASYNSLLNTGNTYSRTARSEFALADPYEVTASEKRDQENVYKGVSLTAFGVGSVFLIKGAIGYFLEKRTQSVNSRKFQWASNIQLQPNRNMDGALLRWTYRI